MMRSPKETMPRNKFPIRKAILSCSYDDSGDNLEEKILAYLKKERKAGKEYVTPLFARNGTDAKDFMKFNFSLQGIPLFFYGAFQLFKAGVEAVVVGNDDTGFLHEKICKFFGITNQTFVHEGKPDEWSFSNTIRKGMPALNLTDTENMILLPGDAPFVDVSSAVNDPDAKKYDAVLALNAKEINPFFPRGYYTALKYKGEIYLLKEPNLWILNLKKLENEGNRFGLEIFDILFKGRKRHTENDSQMAMLKNLLSDPDGKGGYVFSRYRALKAALLLGPANIYKLWQWSEQRKAGIVEKGDDIPIIKARTAQRVAGSLLDIDGFKIKIKPCQDPAGLIDIDTYLCLYIAENLLSVEPKIYPYYDDLQELRKSVGGKWGCAITDDWKSIANDKAKRYGLEAHYDELGVLHQNIFPMWKIKCEAELIQNYQIRNKRLKRNNS